MYCGHCDCSDAVYLHLRALIRLANPLQIWELVLQVWCHLVAVIQPFASLILLHERNLLVAFTYIFDPTFTMTALVSKRAACYFRSNVCCCMPFWLRVFDVSRVPLNIKVRSALTSLACSARRVGFCGMRYPFPPWSSSCGEKMGLQTASIEL